MPAEFKRKQSGSDTVNNKSYVTKNSCMFKLFFNRTIWLGRRHKDALYIDSALQYMDLSLQELLSSLYHTENKSYKKKGGPLWHSRLGIQCCYCSSSGGWYDMV